VCSPLRRAFHSLSLARRLEEGDEVGVTPFEKNLEVWRQLWRVLERSDLVCQVLDARDPLRYRCADLDNYVEEVRLLSVPIILEAIR